MESLVECDPILAQDIHENMRKREALLPRYDMKSPYVYHRGYFEFKIINFDVVEKLLIFSSVWDKDCI